MPATASAARPAPSSSRRRGEPSAGGEHRGVHRRRERSVSAKPNRLEIDLEVSAASELTADAIVKYRDTKRRLQEAFTALKLSNVAVEERGLLVDQKGAQMQPLLLRLPAQPQSQGRGPAHPEARRQVLRHPQAGRGGACSSSSPSCSTSPRTRAGRSAARTKSIPTTTIRTNDTDSGLVRFILDDYDKLEEEAYAKAIADAEARATAREAEPRQARTGHRGPRGRRPQADQDRGARTTKLPRKRLEASTVPGDPGAGRAGRPLRRRADPGAPGEGGRTMNHEPRERDVSLPPALRLGRRAFLTRCAAAPLAGAGLGLAARSPPPARWAGKEVLPKHVTPEALRAVTKGLDYLATQQADDGSWITGGGQAYPVAMTGLAGTAFLAHGNSPTRGKYSRNVQGAVEFLVRCTTPTGLITGPCQDSGQPMHGHGFALMFLASVYGMITKESLRRQVAETVRKAVTLTSQGQSDRGAGPTSPGRRRRVGDGHPGPGAAGRAERGVPRPQGRHRGGVGNYLEKCRTPEGGIQYSLRSGGGPRLPISAAAVATLYNAGQFESPIATDCLKYVWDQFRASEGWNKGGGHAFYSHLYASQGFYMAGDEYWDKYFPATRDQLIAMQGGDGSWNGDGIGQVYGTAIAVIILQLRYKYLPVFQR